MLAHFKWVTFRQTSKYQSGEKSIDTMFALPKVANLKVTAATESSHSVLILPMAIQKKKRTS